jgi:pimeloyl-ACP methyl ester carboxylesterase
MQRFSSFDGTGIAYDVAGPVNGDRPVLLHHGFASTSQINWVRPGLVEAITCAGRRVLLLDARGHGESDRPHDPAAYAEGAMARDVSALLDHLQIGEADMAGYSMGSSVALQAAALDRRIASVLLGGIGPRQLGGGRGGETIARIVEALETDAPASVSDPTARAFRSFAEATGQDRLALAAIQRATSARDLELLASVSVPALVVNGADDTLAGDPAEMAARIPGAKSLVVPGDHLSAVVKPEFRRALAGWAAR